MITKWWKILNNALQPRVSRGSSTAAGVTRSLLNISIKNTANEDINPIIALVATGSTDWRGLGNSIALGNITLCNTGSYSSNNDPLNTVGESYNSDYYINYSGVGANFFALGYSNQTPSFNDYNLYEVVTSSDYKILQINRQLDFDDENGLCLINFIITIQWTGETSTKAISEIGMFKSVVTGVTNPSGNPSFTRSNIMISRDLLPEPFIPKSLGIYTFTYQVAI